VALKQPVPAGSSIAVKWMDLTVVTVCTLAFALNLGAILTTLLTAGFAGQRDFITYWCSGVQLVHRANPYGAGHIWQLERAAGFSLASHPLIMRNAPYALLAVYPLGFFTLRVASLIWTAAMISSAWLAVRGIARTYGGVGNRANLLAIAFAPLLSCLISGQSALFPLLGLTLFLRFVNTRPWLAGASLWLCALKPQDFVPFGVVLLAWSLWRRNWQLLLGATLSFGVSIGIVWLLDPSAWREYFSMMSAANIPDQFVPCLSTLLRVAIYPESAWLQWVPMVAGCIWGLWYLWRHPGWDWLARTPLLILVSVWTAPYSWYMDQSILLVALLPVLYRPMTRPVVWSFALLSAFVEWANLFGVPLGNKVIYPLTATAWLAWYVWATWNPPLDRSTEGHRPDSSRVTAILRTSGTTVIY